MQNLIVEYATGSDEKENVVLQNKMKIVQEEYRFVHVCEVPLDNVALFREKHGILDEAPCTLFWKEGQVILSIIGVPTMKYLLDEVEKHY